jgi:hypothetical protein
MKSVKLLYPFALLSFLLLACSSGLPLSFFAPTTPTPPPAINFAVTIITPTSTPLPVSSTGITGTLPVSGTVLPVQSPRLTNTVLITASTTPELPVSSFPGPIPIAAPGSTQAETAAPAAALTNTTAATQTVTSETAITATTALTQVSSFPGALILLEPAQDFKLQPGINELEFKWQWTEGKSCQPVEGYGFEVRIWPAVTGYGPMGVTDAVKNQPDFYCDPKSNVASYRVVNLKGTPGVAAMESGKFLWDVAYIKLDPYSAALSSTPRLFEIP